MEKNEVEPKVIPMDTYDNEPKKGRNWFSTGAVGFTFCAMVAAIIIPNMIRAGSSGQHSACKSNLKGISISLEMYATDWSGKYPATLAHLKPGYLKTIPECPSAGTDTYSQSYVTDGPLNIENYPDYYYFHCEGLNHEPVDYPQNRPAYDAIQGTMER